MEGKLVTFIQFISLFLRLGNCLNVKITYLFSIELLAEREKCLGTRQTWVKYSLGHFYSVIRSILNRKRIRRLFYLLPGMMTEGHRNGSGG